MRGRIKTIFKNCLWARLQHYIKILLSCVLTVFVAISAFDAEPSERVRTVTDLNGRTVMIPSQPERIACFFGPSYEKVFLLGAEDRVAMMSINQTPWAHYLNPKLKNVQIIASYTSPNIEKMLQSKIDLVFYWTMPRQIETMTAAGIPVVCPHSADRKPPTAEAFIRKYKDEVRFYGDVLGMESKKIAEDYCAYFDAAVRNIMSRTSTLPCSQRPRVYYTVGRTFFSTQGKYSFVYWQVTMAGGIPVSEDMSGHFVDVTAEQIITWDPDIIIMDDMKSQSPIIDEPRFQTIGAVKNKRAYICPQGVFHWGHGSSESILLLTFLAKTIHPELFKDIDLVNEIKTYYKKFYRYALTDEEAKRILNHLPPP